MSFRSSYRSSVVLALTLGCGHPDSGGGNAGNGTGANSTGAAAGSGSAAAGGLGAASSAGGSGGGGMTAPNGGNTNAGSGGAMNGSAGGAATAGTASGGFGAGGSGSSTGGTGGAAVGGTGGAGATGGTGSVIPEEKKPNVSAPASSKVPSDYFVMGETRLLNNNWGAQALGCHAPYEIFVNADKSFGWRWDRAATTCGGDKTKPDYPEVEFGMHPFGLSKQLVTSPDYSSTTILPIQIQDVTTASVAIDGLSLEGSDKNWNMNFEMWFSEQHPKTGTHTTAYGETMNWFGWSSDQYNWAGPIGTLEAGQSYELFVSKDAWPDGQAQKWKYRQYRVKNPSRQFSGTVDVKKILDRLTGAEGWPKTLWISRFEVGTELDDGSSGTVTIRKITFEVNGQKRATDIR